LGGHDLLDVGHPVRQPCKLLLQALPLGRQRARQLAQIPRQFPALGIGGEELTKVAGMLVHQGDRPAQPRRLRPPHLLDRQVGRDVDTVQDVAHVVQHVGGDLSHTALVGGLNQLRLDLVRKCDPLQSEC